MLTGCSQSGCATELRAEAQRMRAFALTVGEDAEVVTEIHAMADDRSLGGVEFKHVSDLPSVGLRHPNASFFVTIPAVADKYGETHPTTARRA